MDKEAQYLRAWGKEFFKSRDFFFNRIVEFREERDWLRIISKDKEQILLGLPRLDRLFKIDIPLEEKNRIILTFNTPENFEILIKGWKHFIADRSLAVYFINPLSSKEKKWVIFPYNHDRIADRGSLRLGLRTIFQSVDPMDDEQIKKVIKGSLF